MKLTLRLILIVLLFLTELFSQSFSVDKIEPPNWWAEMKLNKIQLMIYGSKLNNITADFTNSNISVLNIHKIENPAYAFIDIELSPKIKPGNYKLKLKKNDDSILVAFPVLSRENNSFAHQGFTNEDIIYLIMPDRFADADTSNNVIPGMRNDFLPGDPYSRHGGDIKGIINNLDYIKNLGATAIWINPLVENNTKTSYHGYAATNLYKIDSRFGSNELYKKLIETAHRKGLKIILDHVSNHISVDHPWIENMPMPDWLNGSVNKHELTKHYKLAYSDIHADSFSINNYIKGWFTDSMADLNQANPYVKNYLIENTIWWIEYSGLDGIREDTYPYSDQKYLSDWAKTILHEYPELNIVGEVWNTNPAVISFYQHGSFYSKKFDSNLPCVTDFGTLKAYQDFLTGNGTLYDIYINFAKDFVYSNPQNLLTFLDNHDIQRAIFAAKNNIDKFKIALTLLLTTRGTPEILYGTEIGITGGKDDGRIRSDFPGGFPKSKNNAFTETGRTDFQNKIFTFVKSMIELRKGHKALSSGKFMQLPPDDEVYIYFKILKNEKFMVIINNNNAAKKISINKIEKFLRDSKSLENTLNHRIINLSNVNEIEIEKMSAEIFKAIE